MRATDAAPGGSHVGLPLQIAGVLLLAVLPYLNALDAFWVGDDYNYVVPKTFDTVLNFFNPVGRAAYRPANWLSWAVDYALFGPNPPGWHLTQIGLHVFNTLLVVLLLRELSRAWWPRDLAAGRWIPLAAGAFYAVHPAHPEAVTWVGGRADVPFTAGLLLAAWALARWRTGGRRRAGFYLLAVAGAWLSILGKEAGLVTPLALLLVDWAIPEGAGGERRAIPLGGEAGGEMIRAVANGTGRVGLFVGAYLVPLLWLSQGAGAAGALGTFWARLMPLGLLLVGLRMPRPPLAGLPGTVGRMAALFRDQAPLFALATAYAALRFGLYLTGQGRLMYGTDVHLRFNPLSLLDSAVGYLLVGLGAWEAPQQLGAWPILLKLGLGLLALGAAVAAARWLGRAALFALLWIPATLLITFDAATDRWFYAPSVGISVLAALLLYGTARMRPALRTGLAVVLVILWGGLTVGVNARWTASGEVARGIIAQIRALHPAPPLPATFYMANPPYSADGVLLFNSGFSEAPSYAYQDYQTVKGYELQEHAAQVQAALADPRMIGPHPIFLRYESGRLVEYPSLRALVEAQARAPAP